MPVTPAKTEVDRVVEPIRIGADNPNNSLSYSSLTVKATKALGLFPFPFCLRLFCFDYKALRVCSISASFIMLNP